MLLLLSLDTQPCEENNLKVVIKCFETLFSTFSVILFPFCKVLIITLLQSSKGYMHNIIIYNITGSLSVCLLNAAFFSLKVKGIKKFIYKTYNFKTRQYERYYDDFTLLF